MTGSTTGAQGVLPDPAVFVLQFPGHVDERVSPVAGMLDRCARTTTEGIADPPPAYAGHDSRRGKKGEARLPPAIAVIVAIALYALLPQSLLVGPRLLIPTLELVLLIVVISSNPGG